MNLLLPRIRQEFPTWNTRPVTLDDCWQYCSNKNIIVRQMPFEAKGFYGRCLLEGEKRDFIILDSALRGLAFKKVFLHEIGHQLLHAPPVAGVYYTPHGRTVSKLDSEADFFMACAILPPKSFADFLHEYDAAAAEVQELLKLRVTIYHEHGI